MAETILEDDDTVRTAPNGWLERNPTQTESIGSVTVVRGRSAR
jgi:hypothetical protein